MISDSTAGPRPAIDSVDDAPTFRPSSDAGTSSERSHHHRVAGRSLSARRHLGRRGRQLRAVLRARGEGRAVPVRRQRPAASCSASRSRSAPTRSGTAICPRRARVCSTATGCTDPTSPEEGHRFNPHKLLLDPYAKHLSGQPALERRALRLPRRPRARRPVLRPPRQRGRHAEVPGDRPRLHLGRRPPAARALARHGDLRAARARLHHAPPGRAGRAARHLRRARQRAGDRLPPAAGRHDGRADAGALRSSTTATWSRRGCATTGATTRSASSRPTCATRATGPRERVQDHGQDAALGRHRGDPRRGLQPHRRRQSHGARRCRCAASTTPSYYRLVPDNPRYYMDYTGCGNTLNMRDPRVLQLIMDCLRYWVLEMHVDGFRFDLASALARELHEVDRLGAFFDIIRQDPVLSQVKLIAEPWDLGEGGYQVGNFPARLGRVERPLPRRHARLLEGRRRRDRRVRAPPHRLERPVRDQRAQAARQHQLRHRPRRLHAARPGQLQRQAQRSQPGGQPRRRRQQPVVELRRRGPDRRCRKCNALRARQKRNFIATLLLSQGVPMLLAGDEIGRTQRGNNNAYCQDNEISWVDWSLDEERRLAARVRPPHDRTSAAQHPGVPPPSLLPGPRRSAAAASRTSLWLRPDGAGDDRHEWEHDLRALPRCISCRRRAGRDGPARAAACSDDNFLVLLNAHHETIPFTLPALRPGTSWQVLVDTRLRAGAGDGRALSRYGAVSAAGPLARAADGGRGRRMKRLHEMPFGCVPLADGGVRFRLWAPSARSVARASRSRRHGHAACHGARRWRLVASSTLRRPQRAAATAS